MICKKVVFCISASVISLKGFFFVTYGLLLFTGLGIPDEMIVCRIVYGFSCLLGSVAVIVHVFLSAFKFMMFFRLIGVLLLLIPFLWSIVWSYSSFDFSDVTLLGLLIDVFWIIIYIIGFYAIVIKE